MLQIFLLNSVVESDDRYLRGLGFPDDHHDFISGAVSHASLQSASVLLGRALVDAVLTVVVMSA